VDRGVNFPYGHTQGMRELDGLPANLTDEDRATVDALKAESCKLEADYREADELPDQVDQRLGEIEAALAAFEARPAIYDPADIARAGVFVSIDDEGVLSVDRGYVRPEDEAPHVVDVGRKRQPAAEPPTGRGPRCQSPERSSPSAALRSNSKMTRTTSSSRCRTASSPN
jgi:ParB family chromosome partitioning protein